MLLELWLVMKGSRYWSWGRGCQCFNRTLVWNWGRHCEMTEFPAYGVIILLCCLFWRICTLRVWSCSYKLFWKNSEQSSFWLYWLCPPALAFDFLFLGVFFFFAGCVLFLNLFSVIICRWWYGLNKCWLDCAYFDLNVFTSLKDCHKLKIFNVHLFWLCYFVYNG